MHPARGIAVVWLLAACNGSDPFVADSVDLARGPLFSDDGGADLALWSCQDGVRNGNESDVDCGGAECAGCAAGKVDIAVTLSIVNNPGVAVFLNTSK